MPGVSKSGTDWYRLLNIGQMEKEHGVRPGLMQKIMNIESGGNSEAVGRDGELGLFQLMPSTARELGVDPLSPPQAAEGATRYMGKLLKYFDGDERKAVASYNWGMGNVKNYGLAKAPKETRNYLKYIFGPSEALAATVDDGSLEDKRRYLDLLRRRDELRQQGAKAPTAKTQPAEEAIPARQSVIQESKAQPGFPQTTRELITSVGRGEQRMPFQEGAPPSYTGTPDDPLSPRGMATVGGAAGTLLAPGPLKPFASAAGAGGGELLDQLLHGEKFSAERAVVETALSFLPEALETASKYVPKVLRGIARVSRGGQELRLDEAASKAAEASRGIFQSATRQEASSLFEVVRASGEKIDMRLMRSFMGGVNKKQMQSLISHDVRFIDTQMRTGGKFEGLMNKVMKAKAGAPIEADIIDLQDLSSHLYKRADQVKDQTAKSLLLDLRSMVDQSVMVGSSGEVSELLMRARKTWAQMLGAEDLGKLMTTSPVTKFTHGGDTKQFHLDRLVNLLKDNKNHLAQSVNRKLDLTPGARARFDGFIAEIKQIVPDGVLPISDVKSLRRYGLIAGADQMLSYLIMSPTGQRLFKEAILHGGGKVSMNTLATIVNVARRGSTAPPSGSMETEITVPRGLLP